MDDRPGYERKISMNEHNNNMLSMTNELKSKLLAAQSTEEVAALLKAAGQEASAKNAEQIWQEIVHHKTDTELSLAELESVSGGADRDWPEDGCAATVEYGSHCSSNDACWKWDVTYYHASSNAKCNKCGSVMYYLTKDRNGSSYKCHGCGNIEYR